MEADPGSTEMLDAVEALIDLAGLADVDDALAIREQVELTIFNTGD